MLIQTAVLVLIFLIANYSVVSTANEALKQHNQRLTPFAVIAIQVLMAALVLGTWILVVSRG